EIVPGNFGSSCYILIEEVAEVGTGESFSRLANAVRVGEEESFLRVVRVQPLEEVAQRCGVVTLFAHLEIEHHTKNLTLVVIGNAAWGQPVITVFLEPCFEAGSFRGLGAVCRAHLQGGDGVNKATEI